MWDFPSELVMTQAGVSWPCTLRECVFSSTGHYLPFRHILLFDRVQFNVGRKDNRSQSTPENAALTRIRKGLSVGRLLSAGFSPHTGWCGQNGSHGSCCSQQWGLRSWFTLYFLPFVCSSWSINSERTRATIGKKIPWFPSHPQFLSLPFISTTITNIAVEREIALRIHLPCDYNLSLKTKLALMDKTISKEQSWSGRK